MTYKFMIAGLLLAAMLLPARAGAQGNDRTTRTISGCIHRAEAGGKYKLDGKGGAVWNIDDKSKKVDVGPNVGHFVTVIARVERDPYAGKDHNLKDTKITGLLDIRKITAVGKVCTP